MISISVYSPDQGKEENKASLGKAARCSWYPDLPDPTFQILELEDEHLDPRHILPYSACMFGGKDGELLPYLTEIIVWIQPLRLPQVSTYCSEEVPRVCAVEFHYSSSEKGDIQSMLLGRVPELDCQRYQISIDGPNGERIDGVKAKYEKSHSPSGFVVTGFTFQTSHGRSLHAPEEGVGRILRNVETYYPTQGIPIGFFAALSHHDGFQNTGLLCIPYEAL
ncbi:hypothetical protein CEP52_003313 [Fusarium oligoseptatum]|uniref:Uncharacterized protein n=1 Tax=Fusarium oligoseptatum TaxID=2604345 RepID=A0A428U8Z5_9HYPO|nr:hypothetical protein CEP52_003313 [Fusarium oligoseptatum]